MRTPIAVGAVSLLALAGCGLENLFSNEYHDEYDRPASALAGAGPVSPATTPFSALAPDGSTTIVPFLVQQPGRSGVANGYEMRLPSSKYQMIRAQFQGGNMWLRSMVPSIGEETLLTGVNLDAQAMTEALIVEARLSANRGKPGEPTNMNQLSPDVYVGFRQKIRAAFGQTGSPAEVLLGMVTRFIDKYFYQEGAPSIGFFNIPVLNADYSAKTSPIDSVWLASNAFDYTGSGTTEARSTKFDAALGLAAQTYDPKGCLDPTHIRVVFTVDFNQGSLDGNGQALDRFKWAKDKPDKTMYFAAWIHALSAVQDNAVASLLANGTPNVNRMYDDGTNGDEVAGDNIYTIAFNLPYDDPRAPGKSPSTVNNLRLGYKYTWGESGQSWSGSEEWPGNSRLIEVVDVNGDGIVYRRDVFGDEATNKDRSNFNKNGNGTCDFTTDFRHCGGNASPFFNSYEVYEQPFFPHNSQLCGSSWFVPTAVSPVRVACQ
jgi:hypothetical protein